MMESAVISPGNTRCLKMRGKNTPSSVGVSTPGRSSLARLLSRNHNINNKNNRNGLKGRHLNCFRGLRCDHDINNGNDMDGVFTGDFTREVYHAIGPRIGHTLHIPEDSVQALFNDMKLYPSKDQVLEMLNCARQCGRRNGSSNYITFGEFCVFVKEMKNQKNPAKQTYHHRRNRSINKCVVNNHCEVFLGGSCNPTTWRADTAIPELQKYGITFYNPQVSTWVPELVAKEHDAKQAASLLLYVVDSQTRSTVGMIEVAHLVASGRCVVVVAHCYRPEQSIMGEQITQREYRDLVEGQTTLLTLVRSYGIEVHKTLPSALQCTAKILRNVSDMTPEEQLTSKLRKLREVFDSYGDQNGEMHVRDFFKAFYQLTRRELGVNELYNHFNNGNNQSISFERFCILMAEFTSDNCDRNSTTNGWITHPFQCLPSPTTAANNNTCNTFLNGINQQEANRSIVFDVFLAGTLHSKTKWRDSIAIPILKQHNLTYSPNIVNGFEVLDNKSVSDREVLQWKKSMDVAKVILFVITNDTRSLTTMILAAHYLANGRNVVLYIQQLPLDGCVIGNEPLSDQAIKDYNRGRVYVEDMAKRKQIPVFKDITEAVHCAVSKVQSR